MLFDYDLSTVVVILRELTLGIFLHIHIISWDNFDRRWIYFEQVLRVPDLKKF